MGADDVSLSQRFETLVTFLENHHEYDVVGCSAKLFDGKTLAEYEYVKQIQIEKMYCLDHLLFIQKS